MVINVTIKTLTPKTLSPPHPGLTIPKLYTSHKTLSMCPAPPSTLPALPCLRLPSSPELWLSHCGSEETGPGGLLACPKSHSSKATEPEKSLRPGPPNPCSFYSTPVPQGQERWAGGTAGLLPVSLAAVWRTLAPAGFQPCFWATCKPVQRSVCVLRALCRGGAHTHTHNGGKGKEKIRTAQLP